MPRLWDDQAGIEGMPLQLMVAAVVTGLTLAVVLGWILAIDTPSVIKAVATEPASVGLGDVPADRAASRSVTILVTAYDAKDAPIRDIIVTVRGAVAKPFTVQDRDDGASDGTATLRLTAQLPPAVYVGELSLTIQKAGYPAKAWSVPVLRGG